MKKKEGEKGSAIILAILLLAFFMALSMNMFFIAREKSKNAGVKAAGVRVLSNIDGGASIGYYELALASSYVTEGEVCRDTTQAGTPIPFVTPENITWISPDEDSITDTARRGVLLGNYLNFIGTRMDNTALTPARRSTTAGTGWLERVDRVTGNVTTPITELWSVASDTTSINNEIPSVGGYKIMRNADGSRMLQIGTRTGALTNIDTVPNPIPADRRIVSNYVKRMRINAGDNIGNLRYRVECERTVTMQALTAEVESDELTGILVIFEN